METIVRKIIGRNIKSLRETLGLSQIKFALAAGVSRASIINIESGKTGYNVDLLDEILSFSTFTIEDLCKQNFSIPTDFRDKLASHYRDRLEIYGILNEKPTIVYAIKYKLLEGTFLETPKEINEIRIYFENLGWEFKGTSIQNALKRMPKLISIQKHPTKGNTFKYLKTV